MNYDHSYDRNMVIFLATGLLLGFYALKYLLPNSFETAPRRSSDGHILDVHFVDKRDQA